MGAPSINLQGFFSAHLHAYTFSTWQYRTEMYLSIIQANNPKVALAENNNITYSSTLLNGNAENLWNMMFQSGAEAGQIIALKQSVIIEFFRQDSARRSSDNLIFSVQRTNASSSLIDFCNLIIVINVMVKGGSLTSFSASIKPQVGFHVLKSSPENVEQARSMKFNGNSAISEAGFCSSGSTYLLTSGS